MKSVVVTSLILICGSAVFAEAPALRSSRIGGREYVRVRDVLRYYGVGSDQLDVEADHRNAELNGIQHWLNNPAVAAGGLVWVSKLDVLKTFDPVLRPKQFRSTPPVRVIVIDPGHGGEDRGTRGRSGRTEKELTLDVAKRVESLLAGSGAKVYLTRRSDKTISLEGRNSYAANRRADLFVSIHFNAASGNSANGIETYCLPPVGASSTASTRTRSSDWERRDGNRYDEENLWLAHCVQKSLVRTTNADDRGVRRARFQVLRDAGCPAVLIECGFLSNRSEEQRILTNSYRDILAKAIAAGILEYKKSTQ